MIRRYKPRGSYEKIVAREPHNAKSFFIEILQADVIKFKSLD